MELLKYGVHIVRSIMYMELVTAIERHIAKKTRLSKRQAITSRFEVSSNVDEYDVTAYFTIDNTIRSLEVKKLVIQRALYERTLATTLSYDDDAIHVQAPKIELLVSECIQAVASVDDRIKRLRKRKRYFNKFIDELSAAERLRLLNGRMNDELIEKVQNELKQIDVAIGLEFGYSVENEVIDTVDFMATIDLMGSVGL